MRRFVILLLLSTFAAELAPAQSESSARRKRRPSPIESEIFLGDWWDHYNRAIRRIVAGDLAGAEGDLREAIRLRPDDHPRARTYGVRFQEFFPNAELGAVLFELGRYAEAVPVLRTALAQTDLEQTRFFLHESRRQVLLASGSDRSPPRMTVTAPPAGSVTDARSIRVRGTVLDDGFVDRIDMDGSPLILDRAKSRVEFDMEMPLVGGENRITVEATDLAGLSTREEIVVYADHQGPVFSLEKLELTDGGDKARLRGLAYDPRGVAGFSANGVAPTLSGQPTESIDLEVPLPDSRKVIQLAMADGFGNETYALLDPKVRVGSTLGIPGRIQVAAIGFHPGWIQGVSTAGPEIELEGLQPSQRVYSKNLVVDARVQDSSEVVEIRVNGSRLDFPKGKRLFFSKMVPDLNPGTNVVTIFAKSASGMDKTKTFEIEYIPRFILEEEHKLSLAIPDFEVFSEAFGDRMARQLRDALIGELIRGGRFRIVETDDRTLGNVMNERIFTQSDLTDTRFRPADRSLTAADIVVDGQVDEGPTSISVTLALVAVQTGAHGGTIPRTEFRSSESIDELARILALKLQQAYPPAHGDIFEANADSYHATLSQADAVRGGMQLIAFRMGDPIVLPNGRPLEARSTAIGPMMLNRVFREYSEVREQPNMLEKPRIGDRVVVR